MPYAVALRLEPGAAVEAMWRALAAAGLADDAPRLGYPPHLTLAVHPDEAEEGALRAAVVAASEDWRALPLALCGHGVFPGDPATLWAAPVPTAGLLARHAALAVALGHALRGAAPCHAHYRPGAWAPHVTLGTVAAARLGPAFGALAAAWRGPVALVADRVDLLRFPPVEVLWHRRLQPTAAAGA